VEEHSTKARNWSVTNTVDINILCPILVQLKAVYRNVQIGAVSCGQVW
jgi:hypothetical protein